MTRHPNWESLLADYLSEAASKPFVWGEHDCALYAMRGVEVITGVDPAAPFRGKYSDRNGSAAALREYGAGTLLKTVQTLLPEKGPAFAQRGDLIWNGHAVGICVGAEALFIGEPDGEPGLVRVPRSAWKRAFHV